MNIIEYVYQNLNTFSEKEFNMVDSLVLSQLSYARMEGHREKCIRDYNKLEYFPDMFCDDISDKENKELFMAAAMSPRFRDIRITNRMTRTYKDEQFAAFTFDAGPFRYVAFRGTDGSMAGWRENFRLSYKETIPAQKAAEKYLLKEQPDYAGGQSKGGNLAAYGGIKAGVPNIHCFDSPGFPPVVADSLDGSNVTKYIAESSVVGVLLEDISKAKCVKSDALFLNQHLAYSWKVKGDSFEFAKKLSPFSDYLSKVTSGWLLHLPQEEKRTFVETLFDALEENGIRTVTDLKEVKLHDVMQILESIHNKEVKDTLKEVVKAFSKESIKTIKDGIHLAK